MSEKQFIERVSEACGRTVYYWHEGNYAVQNYPNPYELQLRFRELGTNELYADIYLPKSDKWLLLFWHPKPQHPNHPRCCFHLQENTDVDGPEGIIDHAYSKTLQGCLNALKRLLNE
jgi:hypothetical protein